MKKFLILFLFLTSIIITGASANEEVDPLHKFTQIAAENNLLVTNWEVTIKKSISKSDFDDILNNVRNSHLVTRTEDENSIKYVLVEHTKTTQINLNMQLIVSRNIPGQIELIAVLKGTDWNENIRSQYDEINGQLMAKFFKNSAARFTCIEAIEDGTIENGAVIERFTESLQLEHIEEHFDFLEKSKLKKNIYGYTHLWKEKFVIQGIPYNLQIVVSQGENGKLAYTIGTPILVNEY